MSSSSVTCVLKEHKNSPHDVVGLQVDAKTKEDTTVEWYLSRWQANKNIDEHTLDWLDAAAKNNEWPMEDLKDGDTKQEEAGIRLSFGPFSDIWLMSDGIHFVAGKDIVIKTFVPAENKDVRRVARNILKFINKDYQGMSRSR